jgi:hypothetical protein
MEKKMIDALRKLVDNGFSVEKAHKHLYRKDRFYRILHFDHNSNLMDSLDETYDNFDDAARSFLASVKNSK